MRVFFGEEYVPRIGWLCINSDCIFCDEFNKASRIIVFVHTLKKIDAMHKILHIVFDFSSKFSCA